MTEIILVRHGETELNRQGVFRGRMDVALNERGVRQAESLGRSLLRVPLAAVFTSPLVRALDTARAIAVHHALDPLVEEAFNNIDLGEWQGQAKASVRAERPELWKLWTEDPDNLSIPGGERLVDVRGRAHARAAELAREYDGERIVIVSHRSVVKLMAGAFLGMESGYFWKLYMDNAAYSIFQLNGGTFTLIKWNETCHLEERTVEEF